MNRGRYSAAHRYRLFLVRFLLLSAQHRQYVIARPILRQIDGNGVSLNVERTRDEPARSVVCPKCGHPSRPRVAES